MQKLFENVANLFKVKTIITMIVGAVFAYMAITGAIGSDYVMTIVTMVISFYFGTQHERSDTTPHP